jgi:hypothetical protein
MSPVTIESIPVDTVAAQLKICGDRVPLPIKVGLEGVRLGQSSTAKYDERMHPAGMDYAGHREAIAPSQHVSFLLERGQLTH